MGPPKSKRGNNNNRRLLESLDPETVRLGSQAITTGPGPVARQECASLLLERPALAGEGKVSSEQSGLEHLHQHAPKELSGVLSMV